MDVECGCRFPNVLRMHEVADAFGCSERTRRRRQESYHDGEMGALAPCSGWRPGRRRVPTKRLPIIEGLKAEGMSNREIARRMGVTEKAIRKEVGYRSDARSSNFCRWTPPRTPVAQPPRCPR